MTDPSVNVPAVGAVQKKWVYIGGGVVALIVTYAYIRRRKAATAAPTVDPALGAVGPDGSYINPAPHTTVSSTVDSTGGLPSTDAAWSADVIPKLADSNWDPQFVAVTLGKYLSGTPLTSDEGNLIRAAWAIDGYPPSNTQIIWANNTSAPGNPTQTPAPTPSPTSAVAPQGANAYDWSAQVLGMNDEGAALNRMRALNPTLNGNLHWTAVPGPPGTPKQPTFIATATYRVV